MEILSLIKKIGLPITFILFIFLFNPFSLAVNAGYAMIFTLVALRGNSLVKNIDGDFLVILAFSATYSMFEYFVENRGIQSLFFQATFPVIFYSLGKMMVPANLTNKGIITLLISLGFIYSITALLSIYTNLVQGGFGQTDRFVGNYWSGELTKATKMASYLIYNAILPAIFIANRNRIRFLGKVILIAIYIVTLIASFRLGSRTIIAVSLLSLLGAVFYILSKQSFLGNLKLMAGFAGLILLIGFFKPIDLNSPIFSVLGQRLQSSGALENAATAGSRTALWSAGLENLFKHPLGWKYHSFHHNLWLDMARDGTIIPLLFFLLSNILLFLSLKKVFALSERDIGLNVTFLLIFATTYLYFFTEPVIESNFFAIVVYCLFYGIMRGYIQNKENALLESNVLNI